MLCLRDELLSLLLRLLLERVLAVHLLLKQFVVLAIMLLHVGGQLFGVRLLQRLNGFVVVLEVSELALELLAPLIELLLHILQVHLHVLGLLLVLLLQLGLPLSHRLLIELIFLLALRALLQVLLFELLHFLFQILAFLELSDLILLLEDDVVGLLEHNFHLLLVAAAYGLLG